MFEELINDPFYIELRRYSSCIIDYGILKSKTYDGINTHKEALLYFIKKIWNDIPNISNMKANIIDYKDFFKLPSNYEKEKYNPKEDKYNRPYWYLFLSPPYGTNYTINDFIKINDLLFPKGKEDLEIYNWNFDWSTYFNDGLEWWGARCVSIYDKSLDRFVIILASATD